jgi:hypothetical protein
MSDDITPPDQHALPVLSSPSIPSVWALVNPPPAVTAATEAASQACQDWRPSQVAANSPLLKMPISREAIVCKSLAPDSVTIGVQDMTSLGFAAGVALGGMVLMALVASWLMRRLFGRRLRPDTQRAFSFSPRHKET